MELERERRPVALRLDGEDPRRERDGRLAKGRPRARVERQDDWAPGRRGVTEDARPRAHGLRGPVLGTVDGGEQVPTRRQRHTQRHSDRPEHGRVADLARHTGREVLHQVADLDDPVPEPLRRQVRDGGRGRREQPAREMVGDDAVELLGHRPVEAAQAGLDVRDGDPELRRGERAGERGVGVAVDEDGIRPFGEQDRLEGEQHPRGLLRVRPATDAQRVVRYAAGRAR